MELDFDLALTRSFLVSSYSFIDSVVGGEFWFFSSALSLGIRLCCPVTCQILDMYFY